MTSEQKKGWVFFGLFATLVLVGIAVKRIGHHPELIMFFHLPAAVFLVLAGYKIPAKLRERYRADVERLTFSR